MTKMINNEVNEMGNKAAIKTIDNNVVVFDRHGIEIFNRPRTEQFKAIAWTIMMGEEFGEEYDQRESRKKALERKENKK